MFSSRLRLCLLFAVFLATSGCSTIYVSNVRFSAVEVCSEELASRTRPTSGCLPPTRAENAQSLYLARYRLQVSPTEAEAFTSQQTGPSPDNLAPSWIGRIFQARRSSDTGPWQAPDDGNIEFIPLGGAPEKDIATEVQVKTDISGVVESKLSASAEASPVALVERALGASEVPPNKISLGLKEALANTVAKAGYQRSSTDIGQGTYYYLSMKPEPLDSLTSALARCGWRVKQNAAGQIQMPATAQKQTLVRREPGCLGSSEADSPVHPSVRRLLSRVPEVIKYRSDVEAIGIVIGVAIIRTEGKSELCTALDFGVGAGGAPRQGSSNCEALRRVLKQYVNKVPSPAGADVGSRDYKEAPLNEEEQSRILQSLSFEYSRTTSKELQLYPHTSVLAIHWIPLIPPDPK